MTDIAESSAHASLKLGNKYNMAEMPCKQTAYGLGALLNRGTRQIKS
jgi:hypothetical protein